MSVPRTPPGLLALAVALALLLGSCGGDSSDNGSDSQQATASGASAPSDASNPMLMLAESPGLGMVLVDSDGFTVYSFAKDKGTKSSCYGACAEFWPPVLTEGAPSGEGIQSSKLGTTKRKDGGLQVTYAGKPLYTFAEDEQPGEANGNGLTNFGAVWNVLDRSGSAVPTSPAGGGESAEGEEGGEEEESGSRVYGY